MQPAPFLPKAGHRVVLNDGFPDSRESPLPLLLRECRRLTTGKAFAKKLMYGASSGTEHLKEALATHLAGTRGLGIKSDNLMVTRGAQMALYLASALLIRPGDMVMIGSPNYYFANLTFEQLGATLVRIPVDDQGIDVQAMAAILKKEPIRMLYVVPHHHHPTTVTLSAERRMHLLELIREYKLAVIEDDYDYDFHYASAPILPLASGDHRGNVIYIGSMTKSLALSLRIGFMVAPADFIVETSRLRRIMDLRGDNIMEEALAALLDSGDVDRHLKKTNKLYRERRDLFCSLLDEKMSDLITFRKPDGGMAVWATFPDRYSIEALSQRTSALGLLISDGAAYRQPGVKTFGIRMGFASLNEAEAREAVKLLRKAADQG
jgi:GntR family transcriptional regulator/MocR family aminotransferase